jgi:hypothetical protein
MLRESLESPSNTLELLRYSIPLDRFISSVNASCAFCSFLANEIVQEWGEVNAEICDVTVDVGLPDKWMDPPNLNHMLVQIFIPTDGSGIVLSSIGVFTKPSEQVESSSFSLAMISWCNILSAICESPMWCLEFNAKSIGGSAQVVAEKLEILLLREA